MNRTTSNLMAACLIFVTGVNLLCGCTKQSAQRGNFEFITKNAQTYVVNKDTGDLFFVSGSEYIRLREADSHEATNSPAIEWTQNMAIQSDTNTVNLKVSLKHKWRNGAMDYIFTVAPYGFFEERLALGNTASFELRFYDSDGFQRNTMSINLSQGDLANDDGMLVLAQNSRVCCQKDDYQDYKLWSVVWRGWIPPLPLLPSSLIGSTSPFLPDQQGSLGKLDELPKHLTPDEILARAGIGTGTQKQSYGRIGKPLTMEELLKGVPSHPSDSDQLNANLLKIEDDLDAIKSKLNVGQ